MKPKTKRIALFSGALLVWAGLVAFQVAAFIFVGPVVVGLVLCASLLGLLFSTVIGIAFQDWRSARFFASALCIALASIFTANIFCERQRLASVEAAQPVILAAERFRTATGTYPRSFDDLVPVYLPAEPHTKMGFRGTRFMLSSDGDRFRLSFSLPAFMLHSYDSQAKEWDTND